MSNRATFEKQEYGAVVATILENDNEILEVQKLPDGSHNLIVHRRKNRCSNLWDDITVNLKAEHFQMLGSIAVPDDMARARQQVDEWRAAQEKRAVASDKNGAVENCS